MTAPMTASNEAGPQTELQWSYLPTAHTVPLLDVTRGELVESVHLGSLAVVGTDGRLLYALGDPMLVTYLRSAAKPFQALPLVESGAFERYGFTSQELAVICASHSGEDIHVAAVQSILDKIGLSADYLKCGIHQPFSKEVVRRLREQGQQPTVLHCNCSGKHAGMLALALHHGWSPEGYYRPSHPVQQMMQQVVAEVCGLRPEQLVVGVDGCTAATFALPLYHMAWGFARLAQPQRADFSPGRQQAVSTVVAAMRAHSEMVGGLSRPYRLDTDLMKVGQPGKEGSRAMVSKIGAEGLHCLGLLPVAAEAGLLPGGGVGLAVKVADGDKVTDSEGNYRARDQITIELLRQLRTLDEPTWVELREKYAVLIKNNRGEVVGGVRPSFRLSAAL